jgi:glutathione S-transferase
MLVVHHLENSRSQRVLWLLEELGVAYEVIRYNRDPQTMLAPKELRAIHPLGKSPVIVDDGVTVAETGAIVQYLIDTYGAGRLIPAAGTPERLAYSYWLHYAEGSAMPPLVNKLVFSRIPKSKALPFFMRPIAKSLMAGVTTGYLDPQIAAHVKFWASTLQATPYFAGAELTGADIMMSFPVEAANARASLPPVLTSYLATLHARPAYQAALVRGGPYQLMKPS